MVDYGIPALYHYLPQYLENELVRLEKRAMTLIMTDLDYYTAFESLGVKSMKDHHEHLCNKLFQSTTLDPSHKLNNLLPGRYNPHYKVRNQRNFNIPRAQTNRTMNSFTVEPLKTDTQIRRTPL